MLIASDTEFFFLTHGSIYYLNDVIIGTTLMLWSLDSVPY